MTKEQTHWDLVHPPGLLGAPISDLRDVEPGDLALCGYFCDNLGGGPAGARFLARQIRYFSEAAGPLERVHDLGDLNVFPLEPEKHEAAICEQLDKIAAAGCIPILVGGDGSGLSILSRHVAERFGRDPIVQRPELPDARRDKDSPAVFALDLSNWPGSQMEGVGASRRFDDLLARVGNVSEQTVGGAIFGLAPSLDWGGAVETRLARDLLSAVVGRLQKGDTNANS